MISFYHLDKYNTWGVKVADEQLPVVGDVVTVVTKDGEEKEETISSILKQSFSDHHPYGIYMIRGETKDGIQKSVASKKEKVQRQKSKVSKHDRSLIECVNCGHIMKVIDS